MAYAYLSFNVAHQDTTPATKTFALAPIANVARKMTVKAPVHWVTAYAWLPYKTVHKDTTSAPTKFASIPVANVASLAKQTKHAPRNKVSVRGGIGSALCNTQKMIIAVQIRSADVAI